MPDRYCGVGFRTAGRPTYNKIWLEQPGRPMLSQMVSRNENPYACRPGHRWGLITVRCDLTAAEVFQISQGASLPSGVLAVRQCNNEGTARGLD